MELDKNKLVFISLAFIVNIFAWGKSVSINAWRFTVWRANITRNVLGKSSKHLDCGSIAGVVLLVCLFMHSPLWRHDVGFLSQTSLFVTETFHAEWQSRSQGLSSYVATTLRQQLSPQMSNVFFSFSFVRKTTWSSAHFNHISIIFTCDWSKVYFSTGTYECSAA